MTDYKYPHVEDVVTCAKCGYSYCMICENRCPSCGSTHITGRYPYIKWEWGPNTTDWRQPYRYEYVVRVK